LQCARRYRDNNEGGTPVHAHSPSFPPANCKKIGSAHHVIQICHSFDRREPGWVNVALQPVSQAVE
jgi:hypothetical protein